MALVEMQGEEGGGRGGSELTPPSVDSAFFGGILPPCSLVDVPVVVELSRLSTLAGLSGSRLLWFCSLDSVDGIMGLATLGFLLG